MLDSAVESLCKTISLRVVSGGKRYLTTHELEELLPKLRRKFHVTVGDNLLGYAKATHPMLKKQIGRLQRGERRATRYKTTNARETVDDAKNSIMSTCTRW